MGRDLIKRYSIEKLSPKNLFAFFNDIYMSGKSREFISFAIWELFHRLGLFPKDKYLKFNSNEFIVLENEGLADLGLDEKVQRLFPDRNFNMVRSVHNWKRLYVNKDKDIFGYLDIDDQSLYKSSDNGKSIRLIQTFPEKIKSVFVSSQNTILVSVKGSVYRGSDNGIAFEKVIDLGSEESFFRHNYAVTETPDKTLIIGEYGNLWENNSWRKLAYLYFSSDDAKTWKKTDFLIKKGINKHVHIIYYSPMLKRLFLADGDNKKKLWVSDLTASFAPEKINWKPYTRFHIQTGGYTSVVESDRRILFGTDYQGGTNFIVATADGRKFTKQIVPDPYRRSPIHSLVARKSKNGNEIWANLPISTSNSKSLLMHSLDGGESWNKVIEYNSKRHAVSLISASAETIGDLYCSIKDIKNDDLVVYKITDR